MEKETTVKIEIDEETARKKALNEERNPRETTYGEATQRLNPLTNRPYEDQFCVGVFPFIKDDFGPYVSSTLKTSRF